MKLWRPELSLYMRALLLIGGRGRSFPVLALLVGWCLLRHSVAREISQAT